ncbi:Translation initiation factor IF-2 [Salix suchowensis]|nr:Translation initiation factor IF-2 [Salix suchowensis]
MEAMDTTTNTQSSKPRWKQMGKEEKAAAVHDEMKRINQLPATSTYATHRLRVLNKILQLMSIQVSELFTSKNLGLKRDANLTQNLKIFLFFNFVRGLYHKMRNWSYFLLGCICD